MRCFCGSHRAFSDCCQGVLADQSATTPEQLMRSRFSAYCLKDIDYLVATWHPSQRGNNSHADIAAFATSAHFIKLQVKQCSEQPPTLFKLASDGIAKNNKVGFVEFIACFIQDEKLQQLHEISRFVQQQGNWYYLDGELLPLTVQKIGRNDLCPCQSGKKFKHCMPHLEAH